MAAERWWGGWWMKRRGAGDEAIAYHTYAAYALPALSGLASALACEKANAKTCDVGAVKNKQRFHLLCLRVLASYSVIVWGVRLLSTRRQISRGLQEIGLQDNKFFRPSPFLLCPLSLPLGFFVFVLLDVLMPRALTSQ